MTSIDGSGNAIAVWEQSDGTRSNIWASRYVAADIAWGRAELIEAEDDGDASNPQVGLDAAGNAIVIWEQSDGTRPKIWSNRYVATDTAWGTAEWVGINDLQRVFRPQLDVDGSGNAVAVWTGQDETGLNIWANRYTTGTAWGTPERIETAKSGGAGEVHVAVDGSGNALAIWSQSDSNNLRNDIWANRFTTP